MYCHRSGPIIQPEIDKQNISPSLSLKPDWLCYVAVRLARPAAAYSEITDGVNNSLSATNSAQIIFWRIIIIFFPSLLNWNSDARVPNWLWKISFMEAAQHQSDIGPAVVPSSSLWGRQIIVFSYMKEVTPTANMKLFSLIVSASISSHTDESTQHWGGPTVFFLFPASSGKSTWASNKCIDAWKNKTWCSGFHGEVHLVYFDGIHRIEAALTVKWASECLQNSIFIYFDCCITTLETVY